VIPLVTAAAQPAYAEDAAVAAQVPDAGSEPAPNSPIMFPTSVTAQPARPSADAVGPLAAQIIAASDAAQHLGEQLKALDDELTAAKVVTQQASDGWTAAAATLATLQGKPAASASAAPAPSDSASPAPSSSAAASPSSAGAASASPRPSGSSASSPSPSPTANPNDPAYLAAVQAESAARTLLAAAVGAQSEVQGRRNVVAEQFQRRTEALNTLTSRNSSQLAEAERARDAYEQSLAAGRGIGASVDGLQAAPQAKAAVAFALSQLGKPYEWAEEGPDAYDCSGLVYASYLSVGKQLPRIANTQYGAGVPVLVSQLLPGDLIFFSTDPTDWRQIHHVAMYIGNGKVVQAPTFGDVVKISPIWFSEYFGASRIFPAVPVPAATPSAPPSATADSSASPTPSASPAPSDTPSDSPSPSGSPAPSDSRSPSASPSPSPDPSASASAAASPGASPSPTVSQAAAPSPSPSPSPSGVVESTPPPSASPSSSPRRRLFRR
jgi:cell wall-associated NlpC family hydrolase